MEREWKQQELFNPDDPAIFLPVVEKKHRKRERIFVDYDALYERLKRGPIRFSEIKNMTGVKHSGVAQVITTLSLKYPIYEVDRGVYKLYGAEEYGDGIKHSLVQDDDEWS